MDFFESQGRARTKTRRLVFLFILAVCLIIVVTYVTVMVLLHTGLESEGVSLWIPELFILISGACVLLIGGGSLYKISTLRSGGPAVAELIGGRMVPPDTAEPDERRLMNVVEEMSLASGVPTPSVYVLDRESGINALAAGHSLSDAAVVVTRGALDQLTRDELQGVIAHEFSHILNGDMRLNIRLIGVLFGILMLAAVGRGALRMAFYSGGTRGGRRDGRSAMPLLAVGSALILIGSVGSLIGKLIQAAVSRQREFLADASAVQFTRNPDGISGALKKIGGLAGSRIGNYHAHELSHFFFANALGRSFFGLFSTHPPLRERVRRLDPRFSAELAFEESVAPDPDLEASQAFAGADPFRGLEWTSSLFRGLPVVPEAFLASTGNPTSAHQRYAHALAGNLPEQVRRAAHQPSDARLLVYSLLLDPNPEVRAKQFDVLRSQLDESSIALVEELSTAVCAAGIPARLPILDLAIGTLRRLSFSQYREFRGPLRALIEADQRVTLFEFMLERALERHLGNVFNPIGAKRVEFESAAPLQEDMEVVLSALARAGSGDESRARQSFEAAAARLPFSPDSLRLQSRDLSSFSRLDEALERIDRSVHSVKEAFLNACAVCVAADGTIHPEEAELLRAIADSIECPVPPIIPR
ncbi:MAG TPA: M48 family metallopeptidase [Acidobacteriota bacterium]|nr:M48 family metallopeptidase [Acidobacteriota bacterium]